ncbi:HAMP domain-containing histidine kinase [Nocardioides sp. TRM66260-LWL]|uniref:MtrAB system histidine kinase MtrB n=1 Tax=Nocardioides sp. TRM66260-LWL TaxID=2874478 RepID=UPI001CC79666|nr:MtrAB system histidine kinase MtrB [Nocardioides sp. TRM66260-LWL]MBZ5734203.1 HAMP domain-containing histidine kinase [Nocardioides sp. TRM66260-LWL]
MSDPAGDPAAPPLRSIGGLRALGELRRPSGPGLRRALTVWRRSLQARVLVSTLLLSTLVVTVVGWYLLRQTRDGLLSHRVDAVVAESASEAQDARARLASAPGTDTDASSQAKDLAEPIIARGEIRGYGVILAGPADGGADGGATYTPGLDRASVPASLRARVTAGAGPAWTYTEIRREVDGREVAEPGIVVGTPLTLPADSRTYVLYLLYPLDEQRETLSLVTQALLTTGGLLVLLVAGVALVVTRQVVTPVRMARRVAERLAAGRLQERLLVRGEDDLARLAMSFNQMATNLQRQIRQLEELSRVQRRFTADVSHELRTPLTTVRMAGDVLHDARADFDPATARAAELLQTELDRFETLLADLLEISRFDAGAVVLDLDDVNLVDVAHRIVDATRALAAQRGVEVRVSAPDRACLAEADGRRIERIVRNLVANAIDHAGLGSETAPARVVVHVAADDQSAAIAVRDYGLGLAPGEAAMVFNRFWRADPARARSTGGTGLGLAISLEDAHLHGGWLQAWGRPGEGAQFRLTLPRHVRGTLRRSPLPLVPDDAVEARREVRTEASS